MAQTASQPEPTKPAAAKPAAAKPKEYTLYHSDGRTKKTTDPSTVVNLEFNGWSRTKPKSAK